MMKPSTAPRSPAHPLLDEKGRPRVKKCVEALLRYGDYIYDAARKVLMSYNGRYWEDIADITLSKRLQILLGKALSATVRDQIIGEFQIRVAVPDLGSWVPPKTLINFENGVLDLQKRNLLPHSKDFFFTHVIPIRYDRSADCPAFKRFLSEVLCGDSELIDLSQDVFGYCLQPGNWLHVGVLLLGDGLNGKSTFLEILRHILGAENTSALSLADLQVCFRRHRLRDKLANICEESPSSTILESEVIKNLMSGGVVTCDEKYKPVYDLRNMAKLIYSANSAPLVKDHTYAYYRRLVVIPFDYRIPSDRQDPHLVQKLLQNAAGILNWAIDGLERVRTEGRLTVAAASLEARDEVITDTDSVRMFIGDSCEMVPGERCWSFTIYDAYKDFCANRNYKAVSDNEFGKRLKTHAPAVMRGREGTGRRQWYYEGITLRR